MNIEYLYYIVELDKSETMSQAARNLGISQSGMSQIISKIEKEMKIDIFKRTNQGTVTTSDGQAVVASARIIIAELSKLQKNLSHFPNQAKQTFRIGACNELSSPFLSTLLDVQESESALRIEMVEDISQHIIEGIEEGIYDVGLIALTELNRGTLSHLSIKNIHQGELKLYVTANHYLSKMKQPISLELFMEQEFALYHDEHIDFQIGKFQRKYGPLNISLKTSNIQILHDYMERFSATSLLNDTQVNNTIYTKIKENLIQISVKDFGGFNVQYAWIKQENYLLSKVEETIVNQITNTFT